MPRLFSACFAGLVVLAAGCASSPGIPRLNDLQVAQLADELTGHYQDRTPVRQAPEIGLADAYRVQEALVARLTPTEGKPMGYKVGLSNPAVQRKLGVSEPVSGVLLQKMLHPFRVTVPARFGARPMVEADLLVRVGSEAINDAATPMEVLAALEYVLPFLELPDLAYGPDVQLTGPAIVAVNVGARLGVVGGPIPVEATEAWMKRLGSFRVELTDGGADPIARGSGEALMGHPVQAVMWLVKSLKSRGRALKAGDLISLGSLTPMVMPQPGTTITARYTGLAPSGPVEIFAAFTE